MVEPVIEEAPLAPEVMPEPAVVAEPEPMVAPEPAVVEEPVVEPVVEPAPVVSEPEPSNVISAPSFPVSEVPAVGIVTGGVIGSTVKKVGPAMKKVDKKSAAKEETVAIFSTKNVTWSEVGKVYRGYNIVPKSAADKWLTRSHIRLATPEEVAKEFGK